MDFRKKLFLMNLLFLSTITGARNLTICNPYEDFSLVVTFKDGNLLPRQEIIGPDKNGTIHKIGNGRIELFVHQETAKGYKGNLAFDVVIEPGKEKDQLTISCKDFQDVRASDPSITIEPYDDWDFF